MAEEYQYHAFISYSSKDREWVEAFYRRLTAYRIVQWLEQGRTLWLLDGLDEIFDSERRLRAARIIGNMARQREDQPHHWLVTTRPGRAS
jgi:predicted NACHT family NTPase